jgi:multiple antibiotic resistance protein
MSEFDFSDIYNPRMLQYFIGVFTSYLSIINPFGVMPSFISMTAGHSHTYRATMARKAAFYSVLVLAFFLFSGTYVIKFFGVSLYSLRIAGGLVILRSSFQLLNSQQRSRLSEASQEEALHKTDISLTPLALPLLAGPGGIAATIALSTQADGWKPLYILLAIITTGIISFVSLALSGRLVPFIGRAGLEAVTKVMGFISMAVGVQLILNGMRYYLRHLW